MTKKIQITLEIEVEDDDFNDYYEQHLYDFDSFSNMVFEMYEISGDDHLKVVKVTVS